VSLTYTHLRLCVGGQTYKLQLLRCCCCCAKRHYVTNTCATHSWVATTSHININTHTNIFIYLFVVKQYIIDLFKLNQIPTLIWITQFLAVQLLTLLWNLLNFQFTTVLIIYTLFFLALHSGCSFLSTLLLLLFLLISLLNLLRFSSQRLTTTAAFQMWT